MNNGTPFEAINAIDEETKKESNLGFTKDDKERILRSIEELKVMSSDRSVSSYEKGKKLEDIIKYIILSTKVFMCLQNKHTTSNEFDLLVKLNKNGKKQRADGIIPNWFPNVFLIECKNHNKDIEVGLVGKFYSLMSVSDVDMGVFISRLGISGRNEAHWKDAAAFVNKINLKYSQSPTPKILLDLNLKYIEDYIKSDTDIVEIFETRKIEINVDIARDELEWITPHENAGKMKSEIS